ncbi:MAG: hypothetical protein ABF649_00725 [Bacillus sp. (in: firmicutes)]
MDLICLIRGALSSIKSFFCTGDSTPISGHVFVVEEIHENVTVVISKCEICEKQDISWGRGKSIEKIKEFNSHIHEKV